MGTDRKGQRYCDNCGGLFDKAARVHLGAEYCRACYQRQFVAATCSRCGGAMRAHRLATESICGDCERAERTCLRCGRLTPRAAKILSGKPVCAGCAGHFRAEQICEGCGKASRRVFRPRTSEASAELDDDGPGVVSRLLLLCQPCRTRLTHATCSVCARHRRVRSSGPLGKPLCEACSAPEPITHACPSCGLNIAGSGLGHCLPCNLRNAARRRTRVLIAGLEKPWCRAMWEGFANHVLQTDVYLSKASRLLSSSIAYFQMVEAAFEAREMLTPVSLHEAIDSSMHRRHLLAYRFVLGLVGHEGAIEARDLASEARRLKTVLDRAAGRPYLPLLNGYIRSLQSAGKANRTVRLYAGVAQAFCERAAVTLKHAWAPGAVVEYLKHTPGSAASLSAFISFCREQQQWEVSMPSKAARRTEQARADKSVDRLSRALAKVRGRPVDALKLLEVSRVISAATGLPLSKLTSVRLRAMADVGAGVHVGDDARIDPGHLLHPYAVRWQQLISARTEQA